MAFISEIAVLHLFLNFLSCKHALFFSSFFVFLFFFFLQALVFPTMANFTFHAVLYSIHCSFFLTIAVSAAAPNYRKFSN